MNRKEAKQKADRVIKITAPEEVLNEFSGLLAGIALHNLKEYGFYSFTFNGNDGSVEHVFIEVIK